MPRNIIPIWPVHQIPRKKLEVVAVKPVIFLSIIENLLYSPADLHLIFFRYSQVA